VPWQPTGEISEDPLPGRTGGANEGRIPSEVLAEYVQQGCLAGTICTGKDRKARMEVDLDRIELAPFPQVKGLKAHLYLAL
jgi:hypothetical protein